VQARLKLVIFCGVFGCIFLSVFQPFNINQWFPNVKAPLFIIAAFFCLAGMAALALTQFALRSIFKVPVTTRIVFLCWLLVEFLFISIAIHAVNITLLELSFFNIPEYFTTLKYTLLLLVLPYFLGLLLLFVQKQLQVVEELTLKVNRSASTDNVTLTDENNKIVMSLPLRSISYFKSEDNYTLLYYYTSDNQFKKELIRTSIKKLEQDLDLPCLVRIHRSYMINSQNLRSAIKTSRGYQVKMDDRDDFIPVSATYKETFEGKVIQGNP
jgi:DNA-binding LytR/AlgR family response regulator